MADSKHYLNLALAHLAAARRTADEMAGRAEHTGEDASQAIADDLANAQVATDAALEKMLQKHDADPKGTGETDATDQISIADEPIISTTTVRVFGGCVEPEGMDLEDTTTLTTCPECSAPAISRFVERCEGGCINTYLSLACTACTYRCGDDPD